MSSRYDNGRGTATHLLQHYFRLVAQRAGVQWDSDNDAEVAAIVDAVITASVLAVDARNAARLQARREVEALDLQDFAQQPAEDATQEDAGAHSQRPDVSIEEMDADTVGVLLWDKTAKKDYAYVSLCAVGDTITVYATEGLSVNVARYEEYFRQDASHDPMDVHESPSTTPYYHERED